MKNKNTVVPLSRLEARVINALKLFTKMENGQRVASVKVAELVRKVGVVDRSLREALCNLERIGALERKRTPGKPSKYIIY